VGQPTRTITGLFMMIRLRCIERVKTMKRPFALVLALIVAGWGTGRAPGERTDSKDVTKPGPVRQLKFKRASLPFSDGGEGVTLLKSAEDVVKHLNKKVAEEVGGQVNFATEEVVLVRWQSGGPPFGTLQTKVMEKGREVLFYVQPPPKGGARGEALRIGRDLFAVPKGTKVKFASER